MPVTTSRHEIPTADGTMPVFQAKPEGAGPHPVMVVLMEAFGLVAHIEDVATRLAGEGYLAIAPDVYYRDLPDNKVGYDELPRALELMGRLDDDRFTADFRALLAALDARADADVSRLGVTGFCMGGRLSFLAACEFGEAISAAAPFYGGGTAALLDRAEAIRAPMLLFFGGKDYFIPPEEVAAIDAKLGQLGKQYDVQCYAESDHGFFCEQRAESYDPEAAADAWSRLRLFLREHLG